MHAAHIHLYLKYIYCRLNSFSKLQTLQYTGTHMLVFMVIVLYCKYLFTKHKTRNDTKLVYF